MSDSNDMFKKIDDFLFDALFGFQRIASVLQYYFGLKPTALALGCIVVGQSMLIFDMYTADPPRYLSVALAMVGTLVYISIMPRIERMQKPGFRNPTRVTFYVVRISLVLILLSAVVILPFSFWRLGEQLVIAGLYFMCCDFLPPAERHQWFRKTVASF